MPPFVPMEFNPNKRRGEHAQRKRLDFVLDTSHQTRRALSARTLPLDKPIIFLYHKTNTPTRGRKEVFV